MSELSVEGQESKAVPCYHDHPPQYDSYYGSQGLLTSIIENEHTVRKLAERMDELNTKITEIANIREELEKKTFLETPASNLTTAEDFEELSGAFTEIAQIMTGLSNACKERAVHNTDLYKAIGNLTDNELERTYDSLKRDPDRQIRHELAQDHKDRSDRDSGHNLQCSSTTNPVERAGNCTYNSCSRFAEPLATMDKINEKLPSDTANISKMADDTTAKSPVSFWKKFFRRSARP
ncbi:hypothetical protein DTO012A7_5612 [Penicillium roqueforti]|nr:hypothetical protein CBS147332_2337 [Penicillium roqueforti]KAI3109854.1 hypothetical protein CBS147331_5283 [Penicillium roqueforti]KAI3135199.1 hypothetical protein CBS147330_3251 [Penicillium roqueforti]KAI3230710.1 hypothetical protein DTO012A7_5612 [Penicillium roqueforti]